MKVLEIVKYEDNLRIDTYGPQHPDKMFINQDEIENNEKVEDQLREIQRVLEMENDPEFFIEHSVDTLQNGYYRTERNVTTNIDRLIEFRGGLL